METDMLRAERISLRPEIGDSIGFRVLRAAIAHWRDLAVATSRRLNRLKDISDNVSGRDIAEFGVRAQYESMSKDCLGEAFHVVGGSVLPSLNGRPRLAVFKKAITARGEAP